MCSSDLIDHAYREADGQAGLGDSDRARGVDPLVVYVDAFCVVHEVLFLRWLPSEKITALGLMCCSKGHHQGGR